MNFSPIYIELPNHSMLLIREATIADAEELRVVAKAYSDESEFLPYEKGEFQVSLADEEIWIAEFDDLPGNLLLLAEIDGEIVGTNSLNGDFRKQLSHTAVVGIALLKAFRGQKIGQYLLEAAIEWAMKSSDLEILNLHVHANNERAICLYKKLGFKQVGILPNNIKLGEGNYLDTIIMTIQLK